MKHTIKLLTLAFMLAAILTLTGCPGPVNNYVEPVVVPEYTIEVNAPNGKADYPRTAKEGDSVTLTITPNNSYELENITVIDDVVSLSGEGNTRTFTMPAENVVINVTFKAIESDTTDEPTEEPSNDPTDTNGDGDGDTETSNGEDETTEEPEQTTPEDEETEGDETDTHTHIYIAGGCDVEGCEQRYESDDYQIEAYIYKVINNELVQIDTLYFSFDSSNLTSPIEMITVWGEVTPSITISNLIHLKTKYINARVTYFIGSDISTLNLSEDWDWSDDTYPLDALHTDSPIHIVIE